MGKIWAKRDVGEKVWFVPNTVGGSGGGVAIPGKCCNFSPLLNLETLFPALKLTRYCYLKSTFFFMRTGNLIINWVPLSSTNILCLLTKYEINGASKSVVNWEKYGSVT